MKQISYTNHTTLITKKQINPQQDKMTILDLIREHGIEGFDAPCNGNGTCGKCRIRLISGELSPVTESERRLLSSGELEFGLRLACKSKALSDVVIDLSTHDSRSAVIAAASSKRDEQEKTTYRWVRKSLEVPAQFSLEDQRSLYTRLLETDEVSSHSIDLQLLRSLSMEPRSCCVIYRDGNPFRIESSSATVYGAAIDIGTTTVVVYLLDLLTGKTIDTFSALNAQKQFGADVISRISYSTVSGENRERIRSSIVRQLEEGMLGLCEKNGIAREQLLQVTIAGNTTMLHLLTGSDAAGIAAAPFIPVFTEAVEFSGSDIGFDAFGSAVVELLPSIAAYVGADITAGIEVSGIARSTEPSILLDIGTNGEMALSANGRIICCSTAAGPAFEGANIVCGTGGIKGAIDTVALSGQEVFCTTIAEAPAIGICGSGIIDAISVLIADGFVDYTGRLLDPEERPHPSLKERDGEPIFLLSKAEGGKKDVYLTQKDVREVQLAKAAIAAGLQTLITEAGCTEEEVSHLFLAGGFGSYIHPKSAGTIGLIPSALVEKTLAIGNSSGEGACRYCCFQEDRDKMLQIARRCEYIELSGHKAFQDYYIEQMLFT